MPSAIGRLSGPGTKKAVTDEAVTASSRSRTQLNAPERTGPMMLGHREWSVKARPVRVVKLLLAKPAVAVTVPPGAGVGVSGEAFVQGG
jgi:hypothetical protein